eukprot:2812785-Pyramimonas_sp.AAC.1
MSEMSIMSVASIWTPSSGPPLDPLWIPSGPPLDPLWTPFTQLISDVYLLVDGNDRSGSGYDDPKRRMSEMSVMSNASELTVSYRYIPAGSPVIGLRTGDGPPSRITELIVMNNLTLTSFYGSSCANNGEGALNIPDRISC